MELAAVGMEEVKSEVREMGREVFPAVRWKRWLCFVSLLCRSEWQSQGEGKCDFSSSVKKAYKRDFIFSHLPLQTIVVITKISEKMMTNVEVCSYNYNN